MVEVENILANWDPLPMEAPQPHVGLQLENGTIPLPMNGDDGGM